MCVAGLTGLRKRRFKKTTDSAHAFPLAPNLLNRQFEVARLNQAWVGDITYVWTQEGWLYLATLIDLCSRRIVGWAIEDHMRTDLVMKALDMAVTTRRPSPGLVHHTDRGSQYASDGYRKALKKNGMACSMSRKAECWDNAVAESFFGSLKEDLIYRQKFDTKAQGRAAIVEYLVGFYNVKRLHSTLGYLSPVEYEATLLYKKSAA